MLWREVQTEHLENMTVGDFQTCSRQGGLLKGQQYKATMTLQWPNITFVAVLPSPVFSRTKRPNY